ncbi:MAG: S41 family peptidase [Bacteroidales bacterium]
MKIQKEKITIYGPIILAIVLIGGIYLGSLLGSNNNQSSSNGYYKPDKITRVLNYVKANYVDTVDESKLVEAAIPTILEELDPHSQYIPAEDLQGVSEPLEGNFEGIGIQFNMQKDTIIVVSTISGGPSEVVGIQPGDRIIKVNDTTVAGVDMPSSKVVGMLKGERGTEVDVSVKRNNHDDLLDFTITRDKIPLYSVDISYMIDDSTGYIKVNRFAKTTHEEFVKGLKKLKEQSAKKVIVDLRNNNGGYMTAATNIADQFLKDGKLIVYTEGRATPKEETHATSKGIGHDLEVAVLIDEWSASASEILAGAIQDNDRGIIVGRRSFGKGLVQEQTILPDGSALRLTVARYHTPTGRSIQKPYKNGQDNYYNDLNKRFEEGEFFSADSIEMADSLKHTTPKGDIVYGGGGIMPDFFVPVDTTYHSDFYSEVTRKGLIYQFSFNYADSHRQTLNQYENVSELEKFLDSQNIYKQFVQFAENNNINPDKTSGIEKSKKVILTTVKANIARNIMNDEGYYPILNNIDNTLQKASELLQKGETS